ncbi:MAG: 4-(cytidine 5'-diphospho)-2-C-methyl-D-erythritol kinase [Verrucomicrobiota bacterium]|nr:4-(cytidine 5'-diphospho)-2-C-methyl-D-erythritol kinase [Verrucomicrobiota bacterium]
MVHPVPQGSGLSIFSPAKINLLLAVTGRREDGYHNLISLVAPLQFGDTLSVTIGPIGLPDSLMCDRPEVPVNEDNLVLKAARACRLRRALPYSLHFNLVKRIPMGAGLGGGSSNAIAALRLFSALAPVPFTQAEAHEIATTLGSDCPLFLHDCPLIMRGRGECITRVPPEVCETLKGRPVLLFKPSFAIATPWAFQQLASNPENYDDEAAIEQRVANWLEGQVPVESLLYNCFESVVFKKFLVLPTLFEDLRKNTKFRPLLSGSGSCCFILGEPASNFSNELTTIHAVLGPDTFSIVTFLA